MIADLTPLAVRCQGNMELPTVQRGKRKLVQIKEGQVFLLKSNIPHSPQRPEAGSLGLVVERSRLVATHSSPSVGLEPHFIKDDVSMEMLLLTMHVFSDAMVCVRARRFF